MVKKKDKNKLTRKDFKDAIVTKNKDKALGKVWKKNYHLYSVLGDKNISKKQRKCIIKSMEPQQITGMGKLINDLLYSKRNFTFPPATMLTLKKNLRLIKRLGDKNVDANKKKHIFYKKGGILPFLVPLAMKIAGPLLGAVATGVAGKIFKKK